MVAQEVSASTPASDVTIVETKHTVPNAIFCPKCGDPIELKPLREGDVRVKIKDQGFDDGARGICGCGVVAILCFQRLPKSPTFTMFFDIYRR